MAYFGKATKAKEENNKQTAKEMITLKITNVQMQSYKEEQQMPNLQYLADKLWEDNEIQYVANESQKQEKQKTKEKITVTGKSIFTKLEEYPYEYEINEKLTISSMNGIEIDNQVTEKEDDNYEELKTEISHLKNEIETIKQEKKKLEKTKLIKEPVNISLKNVDSQWQSGNFGDITLLDSIENYQYLIINYDVSQLGSTQFGGEKTEIITVEGLKYHNSNDDNTATGANILVTGDISSTYRGLNMWFKNDKLLHIGSVWCMGQKLEYFRIRSIDGIK